MDNWRIFNGKWKPRLVEDIRTLASKLASVSDDRELCIRVLELKKNARPGNDARPLILESFALLDANLQRQNQMSAYDVQLLAAIELTERRIVEMATGEGKTLTALFPLFYWSLFGKGVLLATANDYLASRDAEFAASVFSHLGVSVGAVVDASSDHERKIAYAKDITYGTATQFGFDFLKDRAKSRFNKSHPTATQAETVQRDRLFTIIVDEVDSLLIDEAATPLVISSAPPEINPEKIEAIRLASRLAPNAVEGEHYKYLKIEKKPELSNIGRAWVAKLANAEQGQTLSMIDWYEIVETAISVEKDFVKERNYLVADDGEILLIDQGTGRIGKGRQWSEGIQQAIQAKENVPLTAPSGHLAKVTLQSFFLSFDKLSGMTGTASDSSGEFKNIYKIGITEIPTRKKNLRIELPPKCFADNQAYLHAISKECQSFTENGRSVLIGARNVKQSDAISSFLNAQGIDNQLLNARQDGEEAHVIGQAGQVGRVTVATNMAGRGTDIELQDEVKQNGGLHVILGGIHESPRIDRQLIGRCARQGDPGSFRIIISLEDDLLDEAFTTDQAIDLRRKLNNQFSQSKCLSIFKKAQATISTRGAVSRKALFHKEKKQLKYLCRAGMDPLLDFPS